MEEAFDHFARIVASLVEAATVIVVAYGCVEAFIQLVRVVVTRTASHGVAQSDLATTWCVAPHRFRV